MKACQRRTCEEKDSYIFLPETSDRGVSLNVRTEDMRRNRGLPAIGLHILFATFSTVMDSFALYCWLVRVVVFLVPGDVSVGG